jgi:hypothetical protein
VWKFVPRVDVLFEIHTEDWLTIKYGENWPDYREWMTKTQIPIYMKDRHKDFPTSRRYPLDEMKKRFSFLEEVQQNGHRVGREKAVFKSTISYMMALAIARDPKPEQINLYGIDMVDGTEWGPQRPDLMRFIGHASEAGIKVLVPAECALMREGGFDLYGYDNVQPERYKRVIMEFEKRAKHYTNRFEALDKDCEYANAMNQTTSGAAQAIAALLAEKEPPTKEKLQEIHKAYRQSADEWEAKSKYFMNEMGQTDGMLQECQDWLRQLTQGDRGWP